MAAIAEDGRLYTWGNSSLGQIGRGTTTASTGGLAIGVVGTSTWTAVSAGTFHTLAIRSDGSLWAWGGNSNGALGNNSTVDRSSPVRVGSGTNWAKIEAGNSMSFAIDTSGNLWSWGYNQRGDLGIGNTINRSSPVQVAGTWTAVTAHIFGGRGISNGVVYSWGQGQSGSLGNNLGGTVNRSTPVALTTAVTNFVSLGKGMHATGYAITAEGVLWVWGDNTSGNFFNTSTVSRSSPIQLTSGVLAVVSDRSAPGLFQWGFMFRINQL